MEEKFNKVGLHRFSVWINMGSQKQNSSWSNTLKTKLILEMDKKNLIQKKNKTKILLKNNLMNL